LLNRAARYFPILEEAEKCVAGEGRILEIGSGPQGIGEFYPHPFIGCDVWFTTRPRKPMFPVMCSGTQLPFADASFELVIASDVIEHVAPAQRSTLISEVLRVARRQAIFGFPSGVRAFALDRRLFAEYKARHMDPPIWLQEHMQYPFPDDDLFRKVPEGWTVIRKGNENLRFHYWLMSKEMHRLWNYSFRCALRIMPGLVRRVLRRFDAEPSYRSIFIVVRQQPA
jgi:Methyltransferase domain